MTEPLVPDSAEWWKEVARRLAYQGSAARMDRLEAALIALGDSLTHPLASSIDHSKVVKNALAAAPVKETEA